MIRTARFGRGFFLFAAAGFLVWTGFSAVPRLQNAQDVFEKALYLENVEGNLPKAIELFQSVVDRFSDQRPIAAKALWHIGLCYEKLGKTEARKAFQRVVDDYPDQVETADFARGKLTIFVSSGYEPARIKEGLQVRRVWEYPGGVQLFEPSPDGRWISFRDMETEDLAIREFATGNVRRLTHILPEERKKKFISNTSWSSDGTKIAYEEHNVSSRSFNILLFDLMTGASHVLFSGKSRGIRIAGNWTGDGKSILAVLSGNGSAKNNEIGLLSVRDGVFKSAGSFSDNWSSADRRRISPDGRFIAYSPRSGAGRDDIYLISVATKTTTLLIENPAIDQLIDFSPDSRKILFLSDRTGTVDIWSIALDQGDSGLKPERLCPNVGPIRPMAIDAAGSLFYATFSGGAELFSVDMDFQTDRPVATPRKISRSSQTPDSPMFSPDGRRLAYLDFGSVGTFPFSKESILYLCIYTFTTDTVLEISQPAGSSIHIQWLDYGHLIVSKSRGHENRAISILDVETGMSRPISGKLAFDERGIFSDKGDILYFIKTPQSTTQNEVFRSVLYRRDPATGADQEVFSVVDGRIRTDVSPDGKTIAVMSALFHKTPSGRKYSIYTGPTKGGDLTEVYSDSDMNGLFHDLKWLPDPASALLLSKIVASQIDTERQSSEYSFWRIPLDGGKPRKIDFTAEARRISSRIDTEGKQLVYITDSYRNEIWKMDGLIPVSPAPVKR